MAGIALFEDSQWQSFSPISLTRATFDIKVGARSYFEEYRDPPEILLTRKYLGDVTQERHPNCKLNPATVDNETLFVNGLLHPRAIDINRLLGIKHTFALVSRDRLIVARLEKNGIEYFKERVSNGTRIELKKLGVAKTAELGMREAQGFLSQLSDIIRILDNSLALQLLDSKKKDKDGLGESSSLKIMGNSRVIVENEAEIEDGTVLDARAGDIFIGSQSHIEPSRIIGPTYIGAKSNVKQFTIIDKSYVGYNCRISGEIQHSIVSDYANKAHSGFLGHSYVGEWVNLGAMTTTSNLKMTYGDIKMTTRTGRKIDTGMSKVGSFFADMSKTSIGTLVYSGRRIGVSAHLHGLVAKDVPSFTIFSESIGARSAELQLESSIKTQQKMMSRRGQTMSKAYEQMMRDVFAMTASERKRSNVRKIKFVL